jgi:hypothetical protein
MRRFIWVALLGGCVDHTYPVGVDALANAKVTISFAQLNIRTGVTEDLVEIWFLQADASKGCPVLGDDVTITLGDTPLTGSRGGYSNGWSPDPAETQPPNCLSAWLTGPTPASPPSTIELSVADARGAAHMTIVAPYAQRSLAMPSALVPGTTAQLAWSPSSDVIAAPASIACITPDPGSAHDVVVATMGPLSSDGVDVPLTYASGVLSFPIPSNPTYHGPLTCYLDFGGATSQLTDCTGFASCTAYLRSGPGTQFDTSI